MVRKRIWTHTFDPGIKVNLKVLLLTISLFAQCEFEKFSANIFNVSKIIHKKQNRVKVSEHLLRHKSLDDWFFSRAAGTENHRKITKTRRRHRVWAGIRPAFAQVLQVLWNPNEKRFFIASLLCCPFWLREFSHGQILLLFRKTPTLFQVPTDLECVTRWHLVLQTKLERSGKKCSTFKQLSASWCAVFLISAWWKWRTRRRKVGEWRRRDLLRTRSTHASKACLDSREEIFRKTNKQTKKPLVFPESKQRNQQRSSFLAPIIYRENGSQHSFCFILKLFFLLALSMLPGLLLTFCSFVLLASNLTL